MKKLEMSQQRSGILVLISALIVLILLPFAWRSFLKKISAQKCF
ncbi:MAG TPA: hypothetical protein VFQ23_25565 [Anaerolineales bacterium]|nr:hypothetical protein [Anaerolineales bacterium]